MRAMTLLCVALFFTVGCSRTGDADRTPAGPDRPADTAPMTPPTPNAGDTTTTPESGTGAEVDTLPPAETGTQDNRSDTGESDASRPR